MKERTLSTVDHLIHSLDRAIRTLTPGTISATRARPQTDLNSSPLSGRDQHHAAGLMRVNHAGEVCAQALYQGQSMTAKLPETRREMELAAEEELDHLAWCEQRLSELDSRPSVLNPLWYGLSFGIGAITGMVSDKISLGFVAATEQQVCEHLRSHLQSLPKSDKQSKAIVEQMLVDETRHAHAALDAGGIRFAKPVKAAMSLLAKVMTTTSYRI